MGTKIRSQGDMTTGLPENWLQIEDFSQIESSDWVTLKQLTTQALRDLGFSGNRVTFVRLAVTY